MSKRVDFESFKNEDGSTDWRAYHSAQAQNGERCRTCDSSIFRLFADPAGYPIECNDCDAFAAKDDEVSHDSRLRCPRCKDSWSVGDGDDYELYAEGEHSVSCPHCDYGFEVSTRVSYSFESPALVEEEDDGEADEAQS